MGEPSAVAAQRLANETNREIQHEVNEYNLGFTQSTNQTNRDIAREANEWNYRMFNEQNAWNLEQWNRENEYNSPQQQMQRYLQAGINPLWAMSDAPPSEAHQLVSANASPAETATMQAPHYDAARVQAEYDPARLGNIIAASQNLSNTMQGFYKLALESEDVKTRKSAQSATAALQRAQAMYTRSQTRGQDIYNNLNLDTYGVQVQTRVRELEELNSRIANTESGTALNNALLDNAKAQKDSIVAQTRYTNTLADSKIEEVKQGWKQLAIQQKNADTAYFNAWSQSYYQGEDLKLRHRQQSFAETREAENLRYQSNSQLIDLIEQQRGWLDKIVPGSSGIVRGALDTVFPGFSDEADPQYQQALKYIDRMQYIGTILEERVKDNCNEENVQSFNEYLKVVKSLPVPLAPPSPMYFTPSSASTSVVNGIDKF